MRIPITARQYNIFPRSFIPTMLYTELEGKLKFKVLNEGEFEHFLSGQECSEQKTSVRLANRGSPNVAYRGYMVVQY